MPNNQIVSERIATIKRNYSKQVKSLIELNVNCWQI